MDFQEVKCDKGFASCINDILIKNDARLHYIEPDGNSFFTALVKSGAFTPQETPQILRNRMVEQLQTSPEINVPLRNKIEGLRKTYTWGWEVANEVEKYASSAFNIHLIIYDVHDEEGKLVIKQITYQHANATSPIVSLLRTGFSSYSALSRLPSEKTPRAREMAHIQSDGDVIRLSISYILSSTPKRINYLPNNTGESTVKGLESALNNNAIFNVELTSHRQLTQEVAGQLVKSGLERNEPIMEHMEKSHWYNTIKQMMVNRSPKVPHPTLLQLCETPDNHMHRCLRAIHHYFGAFMDHCHDWKKISWCVLSKSLKTDIAQLVRMVDGLPPTYNKKQNIKKWIGEWKDLLETHIRTGDGVNEKRCREYLIELNEEYIRQVNDPEIMINEPLAYWLPTNFYHTVQQTWEFSEKERAAAMGEMKTYLKKLGIRALYLESGANWMENLLDPRGNKALTLDEILKSDKLVALGLWPHAAYNAASCGKTFCSALAGPCENTCSIDVQMGGMDILGARIDVIVKGNPTRVNLIGLSPEHKLALETQGGILIQKGGAYVLRPGDPVELSLNALAKEIEDSIGLYGRGDVNRGQVTELKLIYSANITIGLRDEMVTILKTWTDSIQLRGVSALKMKIMMKKYPNPNILAVLTLDNMCMESAVTEDIPFLIFSSSIRSPKDGPNSKPTRHRYTLYCFDNTAVKANEAEIFNRKAKTFAWICEKVAEGTLEPMLDTLLINKKHQLELVADSVADPVLFFVCHQLIDSIDIHKRLVHEQCDHIRNLIKRMEKPDDITKRTIENVIETGPRTPSDTLEHFANLHALSEDFNKSVDEMSKTMNALSDAFTPIMFLDSYTAARQDVRNSGITNIEHEIELYAVCMMVMEYVRTGHDKAMRYLINIHTNAFYMINNSYTSWEAKTFDTPVKRQVSLGFDGFKNAWAVTYKSIKTAPQDLLKQLHHPVDIANDDEKTSERGIGIIIDNSECKDILKATSMCLYILNKMRGKDSDLSYAALNETYNANMTNEERKQEAIELAKSGKRAPFQTYYEQLQEQKKTFTLRTVGVPFATFVKKCLNDPNLNCKNCPPEKQCVVCTAKLCRVVGYLASSNASATASRNVPMNAPAPPAPLVRTSSSTKRKQSNVTGGTRKRSNKVRKTRKRQQHKRQKRKTQKRKTRKN